MTDGGVYEVGWQAHALRLDSLHAEADSVIRAYLHAVAAPATDYQRKEAAKLVMQRAYLAFARGDTTHSRNIYRAGRSLFPYLPDSLHVRALNYLGQTYFYAGQYSDALALWNEAEAMALSRNVDLLDWIAQDKKQLMGLPLSAALFEPRARERPQWTTYAVVLGIGALVLALVVATYHAALVD